MTFKGSSLTGSPSHSNFAPFCPQQQRMDIEIAPGHKHIYYGSIRPSLQKKKRKLRRRSVQSGMRKNEGKWKVIYICGIVRSFLRMEMWNVEIF